MEGMGNMVYVFSSVARVHPNDFCICSRFKLLGPCRSDKYLWSRNKTREEDEIAQRRDLGDSLDGTLSKNGEETCMVSVLIFLLICGCLTDDV